VSDGISRRECIAGAALLLAGCGAARLQELTPGEMPPPAPREFRGAWVATVDNIDWPSAPGLPAAQQQSEVVQIVERAAALGLNALLLQVRPAADAIYPSNLEPWSEYLSGGQGVPMDYDPLAFWISEAHRRGLELHAWFNPFRARHRSAKAPLAPEHIARTQPAWVKSYGDQLWLDPGEPGVQQHSLNVIADVVQRYDIDGVHIDDYFYPYPVNAQGRERPFPDAPSWQRAQAAADKPLARDDWRRANVDRFVRALYESVHRIKPWLRVGVSPFGLPRAERRQPGIEGFDPHARLYADAEHWLAEGWLDYVAPQLYWTLASPGQAFATLLDAWVRDNSRGRHLWPGLFSSSVARPPRHWPADEILNQIALLRSRPTQVGGHIHFSMAALIDDRGSLAARLKDANAGAAMVPATSWLGAAAPDLPSLSREQDQIVVRAAPGEPVAWFAVWKRQHGAWRLALHPAAGPLRLALGDGPLAALVVSSVGRTGIEGGRASMRLMAHD
jgi:uncharacterized lipoprotein YddW (UPF0748 family)